MTENELTNIISESIAKHLLNEEDGKWEYISGVLYRYNIKHDMGENNGKNIIRLLNVGDSLNNEVVSFLDKMGYHYDDEESKVQGIPCFSDTQVPLNEDLTKSDVMDIVKKDKDFEKKIKDIVRDTVTDLFRVLYQHNNIFKTLGR